MIQKGTYLTIVDNSGGKEACCIHVKKGFQRRYASIGDLIIVSIKSLRKKFKINSKIKKGEVYTALVVKTKITQKNLFGNINFFFENSIVLLNKQNKLVGSRIFGALPIFFRKTNYCRILALSSGIIK